MFKHFFCLYGQVHAAYFEGFFTKAFVEFSKSANDSNNSVSKIHIS